MWISTNLRIMKTHHMKQISEKTPAARWRWRQSPRPIGGTNSPLQWTSRASKSHMAKDHLSRFQITFTSGCDRIFPFRNLPTPICVNPSLDPSVPHTAQTERVTCGHIGGASSGDRGAHTSIQGLRFRGCFSQECRWEVFACHSY